MKNITTAQDIRMAFTNKVNEYLAEGLQLTIGTMQGSQSNEICKVDLTDGKVVYRVRVNTSMEYIEDDFFGGGVDTVELIVEKFNDERANDVFDSWHTLWNDQGEIIETAKWYSLNDRGSKKAFVESREDILEVIKIRSERRTLRRNSNEHELYIGTENSKRRTEVRDLIRKSRGYARVKRAHIAKVIVDSRRGGIQYKAFFTKECGKSPVIFKTYRVY